MEKIIGSLAGVWFHAFDNIFDIFFTEERIIACNVKHHSDIPYQQSSVIRELFIPGLSRKRAEHTKQAQITYERRQSLQDKTPDELMALHRSYFEIPYSEIISVEISRGLFRSYLKFNTSNPSPLRKKILFLLSKKQIPDAQGMMERVLASKVRKK